MDRLKRIWEAIEMHLSVWQAAWRAEGKRKTTPARNRVEVEFLPAALEIQERPPHPMARAIGGSVVLFFIIAILWASVGEVDIVAVARGKIIPSDRVKSIQPLEIGVVRAIHVEEGQAVKLGDLLLELDPTSAEADSDKLRYEMQAARGEQARLKALLAAVNAADPPENPTSLQLDDLPPGVLSGQNQLLRREYREYRARLGAHESQIGSQRAEREADLRRLEKLQATLPILEKRVEAYKKLEAQKLSPELEYLELEQQRIEHRHEIEVLKERSRELQLRVEQSEQERRLYEEEFRRKLLAELFAAERRLSAAQQDLRKAERRSALQALRAPVDGVVQELAMHTIGGVVTPAQVLMNIVPEDALLAVEAWVENKDIGFVYVGDPAAVKIDTFPFTKYGSIEGTVGNLSTDAVEKEHVGLVYAARILMDRSVMEVDGKRVNLTPGMTVTAEVKTGKRRIIEYLLAPLLRYKAESMQER